MRKLRWIFPVMAVMYCAVIVADGADIIRLPFVHSSGSGDVTVSTDRLVTFDIDSTEADSSNGAWETSDIDLGEYTGMTALIRLNRIYLKNDSHEVSFDSVGDSIFVIVTAKTADLRGVNDITVKVDTLTDTGNLTFWLGQGVGWNGKDSLRSIVYFQGQIEDTNNEPYMDTINTLWYYDFDVVCQRKR